MSGAPERIGKYRVLEPLGRGGMGAVYKAHDPQLDRLVAIKVMAEGADVGVEARERFLREAQSAARLNHPHIITVYELGEDQGQIFIVMELLEGEPLSRVVDRTPPLPLRQKLNLMIQICSGLAFAHQRGVVHRDIKPANIFVLRSGQVKILDFGIARLQTSELTRTGLVMGTPNYMSPEQARGRRTDARSDIFSVGVVFYELLSGQKPFGGEDYFETMEKVRSEPPPPLEELAPSLPPALVRAVSRALAKDPAARYQSLDALRADLEVVLDLVPAETPTDLREEVDRKFAEVMRLHRVLVAAVGAAALGEETLPLAEPHLSDAGLTTILRDLESQAERLRGFARTVESLEPKVARGIAAFERGAFDEAVAELDAVLREVPQHQRARDYRDRARLEEFRERTVRTLGPTRGAPQPGSERPTVVAGPRLTPREPAGAIAVATPPPRPLTEGGPRSDTTPSIADATRSVSDRRGRLVLAGVALVAILGGGAFLYRFPSPQGGSAPSAPAAPVQPPVVASPPSPPAPAAPAPAAPAESRPAPAPAPQAPRPTPPPAASKPQPAPAGKPAAAAPAPGQGSPARPAESRLTADQRQAVADYLELAQFHRERGDNQRALSEYQRALEIDPENVQARKGRAEVEQALKARR
ncbi:MAG TPA: protein kinase [Methylomirabilota bacterium]|nr:protein kinase [Methylomirabilota bacterium]